MQKFVIPCKVKNNFNYIPKGRSVSAIFRKSKILSFLVIVRSKLILFYQLPPSYIRLYLLYFEFTLLKIDVFSVNPFSFLSYYMYTFCAVGVLKQWLGI